MDCRTGISPPVLEGLLDVLRRDGSEIGIFRLREMKLAHCLGCFGCLVKTPGMCVEDDAGRQIVKAVIQTDTTVLCTPVTFGGYSPGLKKMMDRHDTFQRLALGFHADVAVAGQHLP